MDSSDHFFHGFILAVDQVMRSTIEIFHSGSLWIETHLVVEGRMDLLEMNRTILGVLSEPVG